MNDEESQNELEFILSGAKSRYERDTSLLLAELRKFVFTGIYNLIAEETTDEHHPLYPTFEELQTFYNAEGFKDLSSPLFSEDTRQVILIRLEARMRGFQNSLNADPGYARIPILKASRDYYKMLANVVHLNQIDPR
jgi:hypothetical protein